MLKTHGVDHLTYSELCQLLFQNDPWLLPEVSANGVARGFSVDIRGEARWLEDKEAEEKDSILAKNIAWRKPGFNFCVLISRLVILKLPFLPFKLGWYRPCRASVRLREPV